MTSFVKTIYAGLASFAALAFFTVPASAQSAQSESANVDAIVTVRQATQPPLAVTPVSDLLIGTVTIPNTAVPVTCYYDVSGMIGTPSVIVTELNRTTDTRETAALTSSGCEHTGPAIPGRLAVTCEPSSPLTVTVQAWMHSSHLDGVFFQASEQRQLSASYQDSDLAVPQTVSGNQLSLTCPAGDGSTWVAGAFDVHVGGTISVNEYAMSGDDALIGYVTLTASY